MRRPPRSTWRLSPINFTRSQTRYFSFFCVLFLSLFTSWHTCWLKLHLDNKFAKWNISSVGWWLQEGQDGWPGTARHWFELARCCYESWHARFVQVFVVVSSRANPATIHVHTNTHGCSHVCTNAQTEHECMYPQNYTAASYTLSLIRRLSLHGSDLLYTHSSQTQVNSHPSRYTPQKWEDKVRSDYYNYN